MESHSNDPVGHVHDVLAFNSAFHVAKNFIDQIGGVLISTSDHETGGITVGRQVTATYPEYVWFPEVLANANHSEVRNDSVHLSIRSNPRRMCLQIKDPQFYLKVHSQSVVQQSYSRNPDQ